MSRITAFAAALALALIGLPRPGATADAVVLQLHGPAQFEFAGYYAALWKGFYRDAGLAVEIHPGGLSGKATIDPVRELAEGRAQFGTGNSQLVVRTAQGLPLLLVAPIFQSSGAAVYYRADSDFSTPAALMKAKLGRLPASDILDIELVTALRAEGIDPARIKSVNIDQTQIVPGLADKAIDASIGSAWIVPWQAHERGIVLKSFNPANYRVEYYGDSLFTLKRYAAANADTVARFRAATLKGWEYALQHPDEIAGRLVSDPPSPPPVSDPAGFARYQIDVARRLVRFPDTPLGNSNLDRWTQIEAGMLGAGVVQRNTDLTDFVYNLAAEPQPGQSTGTILMILGVVASIAGLAAAVWFGLRYWRPRTRAEKPAPTPALVATPAAVITQATVVEMPAPTRPSRLRRVSARRERPTAEPPALPAEPPPPPLPEPIDLNVILAPLERRIRQRVRGKVRFRFSLLPELWPCRTEAGAVAGIVLDLVGVATAIMSDDGSLIVGTRNIAFDESNVHDYFGARIGEFARITVRDSGPALSDDEFLRIFDPRTSVRPAIAAAGAAVERIGGFMRVETAEGVGTAVHLYFARVAEVAEAMDAPTAQVAE